MKRALAERAKFQEEQADGLLHHISGNDNTGVDVPGVDVHGSSGDLNNASPGLGTIQSTSPFLQQQQSNMQHHQQQRNEQKDDHMRVEAPPRKIPKIKSSSSPRTPTSIQSKPDNQSSNGARNKSSLTEVKLLSSSNPKKRSRPPSGSNTPNSVLTSPLQLPTVDEEEDDEQNEVTNTKFYLKHQNRALASELYKYKHAIAILEQERNVRREECKLINGAMRDIVSYWNGMEGVLLGALGSGDIQSTQNSVSLSSIGLTTSTGDGGDVENVYSIMQSIIQLSDSAASFEPDSEMIKQEDGYDKNDDHSYLESDSLVEQRFMKHLSNATTSFSKRLTNFQRLVLHLVHQNASQSDNAKNDPDGKYLRELLKYGELKKTVAALQNSHQDLEIKLEDVTKDRDIAKDSERKVRRGLYRAVSGRMKITEVLKAVEESTSLGVKDLDELQKDLLASSSTTKADPAGNSDSKIEGEGISSNATTTVSSAIIIDGKTVGVEDVMEMKKKIDDLILINESRDKKISELMTINDDMELRLTAFMAKNTEESVKEDDVLSSPIYIETVSKLEVAERENEKLQNDLQSVMERWAVTKGDLELSRKTVDDLEEKHKRRLKELSGEEEDEATKAEDMETAKRVVQLEHKLKHALDSVRQAEAMKSSLIDATKMMETLQRQVNELKEANEQLEAAQEEINADLLASSDENVSNEKVQRLRKEFNALMQSKENAKRNLELSEKERDSLLAINTRLQQQMVDKEDMNAKSLSTILHLRQLNEQLEQEKSLVEKKLKSAEQLAVMARLTGNARDKVEREAMQEKEVAEEELKQMKENYEQTLKQNDEVQRQLNISKSEAQKARDDLRILKERCDNLVSKSSESDQQIKQLSESLVVAKKDAVEAMQKAAAAAPASGSQDKFNSEFTAEQLTIQVNQLKSRLACPVCNTRDKKVIITRCRHMFCRHCVALNLENRNRKCPSCGIKFDKKDVEDVWF